MYQIIVEQSGDVRSSAKRADHFKVQLGVTDELALKLLHVDAAILFFVDLKYLNSVFISAQVNLIVITLRKTF